jgi:hypothetical protein
MSGKIAPWYTNGPKTEYLLQLASKLAVNAWSRMPRLGALFAPISNFTARCW